MGEIGKRLLNVPGKGIEIETFEVPEPGPGQVLVRVNRSQVSAGTELSAFIELIEGNNEEAGIRKYGGYNTVGTVLSAGPGMEEYKPGDRVLSFGNHGSHWLTGGDSYSPVATSIQKIEYDITDEQAAFARLGDVAMHSVRRAELQLDESVAVFGQGVVGQLTTAFSRLSGAYPVIGVDLDDGRLELSKQSGATHTVNASKEDSVKAVRSLTKQDPDSLSEVPDMSLGTTPYFQSLIENVYGNAGVQCAFHVTRSAKTLVDCMKAAADRGKIILIASPRDTVETGVREEMLNKELQIRGSSAMRGIEQHPHPYWPWTLQRDRSAIMRMIATGELKVDHLISHVAKPEEADDLYKQMASGPTGWMSVFFDWE